MEHLIRQRIHSMEKYQSFHQRRRRMSSVAPINNKGLVLDFQGRIAVCKN